MPSRGLRWLTLAVLGGAVALSAASFGARALACETMRMTEAERPPCCDFGSKDRVTRDGGDCCKALWSAPSTPAAERLTEPSTTRLELADVDLDRAGFLGLALPAHRGAVALASWEHAVHPPGTHALRAPFDPVATTVLRN